ncbi:MAG: bile acid:sodium symporter family protein [Bacteroidales bacterium]|nr:bile acid:sodium symporter family protein [Bacteroidales bacterium]
MDALLVLDQYKLNFNASGLHFLNVSLAIIMFGVALDIRLSNFKTIFFKPKSFIVGLVSQFLLLPSLTFLLIFIIKPTESVALGMILVAACPGGNISNFISSLAKGNVELSLSLTGFSTMLSVLLTPLNFSFWGSLYVSQSNLIHPISIDFLQMFQTVVLILGLPLILGVWFNSKKPIVAQKIKKPIKILSIIIFLGFIVVALANNFSLFLRYIHLIFLIVLAHNLVALLSGYFLSTLFKSSLADRKTITIETGIQNSGLALVLIFNPKIFPEDIQIGGMAFIAAWWGIWHMISGLAIAMLWHKKQE